jgi:hypothetical protein
MRGLIRCAARLYPLAWRRRYGVEFDALLEDIAPSWRDLCDVLGRSLMMRGRALAESVLPIGSGVYQEGAALHLRFAVVVSLLTHVMFLGLIVMASWASVESMPLNGPGAPPPPPVPAPPADITDSRVFAEAPVLYSSLPLRWSANGGVLFSRVVNGVGIYFPPLPDAGTTDRRRNPIRRVCPGQALEANFVRRVLPRFPPRTQVSDAVSVFLEYLIGADGSVKVLRTSGPILFANAARSALEAWKYRPMRFENRVIEVVSRVEVRFDGELANVAP